MDEKSYLKYLASVDSRYERLYNELMDELARIGVSIDDIPNDKLFSFDDYPQVSERVTEVLKQFQTAFKTMITQGIDTAMIASFAATSKELGKYTILSDRAVQSLRNTTKQAFLTSRLHPKEGLSLSQKVWNYSQQAKSEFEAGMSEVVSQGISQGISAEELGRQLRSMLRRPDEVYRRYHEKKIINGEKKDVINWYRKRVDADGKVHYVKGDMELVGRGQYRSSRQNALRLAATEINMAYRYADCMRWQKEPFVIGIRIQLSGNHTCNGKPFFDMCDELVGDYPKDFLFTGWHPRCRCVVTSIHVSDEEWEKIQFLPKEEYENYVSPNLIKDMPQSYYDYIEKNSKYLNAAVERGKAPYWVKDNYVEGNINNPLKFDDNYKLREKYAADMSKLTGVKTTWRDMNVDSDGAVLLSEQQHRSLYEANVSRLTKEEEAQTWAHGEMYQHPSRYPMYRDGYVENTENSMKLNFLCRTKPDSYLMSADEIEQKGLFKGLKWHNSSINEDWQFTKDDVLTMKALDKATRLNEGLPFPIKVVRNLSSDGVCYLFGAEEKIASLKEAEMFLSTNKNLRAIEKGYLSTSLDAKKNIFGNYDVSLSITVRPNTPMYITANYNESEVLFKRGSLLYRKSNKLTKEGKLLVNCVM